MQACFPFPHFDFAQGEYLSFSLDNLYVKRT
jgi:hypothetical protein